MQTVIYLSQKLIFLKKFKNNPIGFLRRKTMIIGGLTLGQLRPFCPTRTSSKTFCKLFTFTYILSFIQKIRNTLYIIPKKKLYTVKFSSSTLNLVQFGPFYPNKNFFKRFSFVRPRCSFMQKKSKKSLLRKRQIFYFRPKSGPFCGDKNLLKYFSFSVIHSYLG